MFSSGEPWLPKSERSGKYISGPLLTRNLPASVIPTIRSRALQSASSLLRPFEAPWCGVWALDHPKCLLKECDRMPLCDHSIHDCTYVATREGRNKT